MIYSNFPTSILAKSSKSRSYLGAQIVIGEENDDRYIRILCPNGLVVERGINTQQVFTFNRYGTLTIKEFQKDWKNFDDPYWNTPNSLFLMLTSYSPCKSKKDYVRNGIIQTLEYNSLENFRMYARINIAIGRNRLAVCGIYKVSAVEPCLVKITPPTIKSPSILLIDGNNVEEYQLDNEELLHSALCKHGMSANILNSDWVAL